jgi:outer membrane protein, multidrug efflux system
MITMRNKIIVKFLALTGVILVNSCIPSLVSKKENKSVPANFNASQDSINTASGKWNTFLKDPYLVALIDSSLKNNQELNIITQEIAIAKNNVREKKGQFLPFVNVGVGAGIEKSARYTRAGAVDENINIAEDKAFPQPLPDFMMLASASWEIDIWKKLRNAKKSAMYSYLATTEGKNFMVTNLVVEIASSYYELMALDNIMETLKKNIEIQENALNTVMMEKNAARVTDLAVRRFEAEIAKNKSRQFLINQQITEVENRINFLVGRFPQPIIRNSDTFNDIAPETIYAGIPSQLLENRADIRQTELELSAAKLDIKVTKANFYPVFNITAGLGYQAFNTQYLLTTPKSMLYNLAGSLVAPLINRNAIKATYNSANARQIQAVYNYERTILKAYTEVANQQAKINNLAGSYNSKSQQVEALTKSINISINLFKSARADYVEVLLTQRDALDAKMELIETKKNQMNAMVKMYQVLGGGWR